MKRYFLPLIIFTLALTAPPVKSQSNQQPLSMMLDSIYVHLDDRDHLWLVGDNRDQFLGLKNLDSLIQMAAANRQVWAGSNATTALRIDYDLRQQPNRIDVASTTIPESFQLGSAGPVQTRSIPDTLTFLMPDRTKVFFFLNGLDHLSELAQTGVQARLKPVMDKIQTDDHYFRPTKVPVKATFDLQTDSIKDMRVRNLREGKDQLELSAGAGAGLIRHRLVPELGARIMTRFADRQGIYRHQFGANLSLHYFFEEKPESGYKMNINGFLTAEYGVNFAQVPDNQRWLRMGLGRLMIRNGDYFEGETWKFSLGYHKGGSNFRLVPELYMTDNFRTFFPGVRVGIGL